MKCVCLRENKTHKVIWPNHIQTKAYSKSALLDFTGHFNTCDMYWHLIVMDELSQYSTVRPTTTKLKTLTLFFTQSLIFLVIYKNPNA